MSTFATFLVLGAAATVTGLVYFAVGHWSIPRRERLHVRDLGIQGIWWTLARGNAHLIYAVDGRSRW